MSNSTMLDRDVLDRRTALPVRMNPVTLVGKRVKLVPLDVARDAQSLWEISNGAAIERGGLAQAAYDSEDVIWRYMLGGPFENHEQFNEYLRGKENSANGIAFTAFDAETNQQVGMATYMNNEPSHLKVELGSIWYSPIAQGKGYNPEAVYLMLKHAFELGYRRVEWKCDNLNERSKRTAERLGFTFEGVQDCHFIIKEKNRDTAWFRMLDREWSDRRGKLEKLIAR